MTKTCNIVPVIISGGSGTRLWPISRKNHPKQFGVTVNGKVLFSNTLERANAINSQKILIVCNYNHRFFALRQMRDTKANCQLLLEPCARNTAPAFAMAAYSCEDSDPLLLFMPADHLIDDDDIFVEQVCKAARYAEEGAFVTFGIQPTRVETAYGHIITGDKIDDVAFAVEKFAEKPNQEHATEYMAKGNCLWNSGVFMCKKSVYQDALEKYQPTMAEACKNAWEKKSIDYLLDNNLYIFDEKEFAKSPNDSIDYAIVEHLTNIISIPLNIKWSDLGSWSAMTEVFPADSSGNYAHGNVVFHNSKNNIAYSESKLVTLCGVNDLIVVQTANSILVANKNDDQSIKQLVKKLHEENYMEGDYANKIYRPWGSYEQVDTGENFQVKRLIVDPGQRLSLQSHKQRSEHWVVVRGVAEVTLGDKVMQVHANQSVCIPVGEKHCLANKTNQPLWLIEVQCGDYLGEDDIERYDDIYGRQMKV